MYNSTDDNSGNISFELNIEVTTCKKKVVHRGTTDWLPGVRNRIKSGDKCLTRCTHDRYVNQKLDDNYIQAKPTEIIKDVNM